VEWSGVAFLFCLDLNPNSIQQVIVFLPQISQPSQVWGFAEVSVLLSRIAVWAIARACGCSVLLGFG